MGSLISMENTPQESAAEIGLPTPDQGPKYPWGLQICLNNDALEKLGIKMLPPAGTVLTIVAKADVVGTREEQTEGQGTRASMDLQITDMQLDGMDTDVLGRAAELLYGTKK